MYDRRIGDRELTFGVSGRLYQSNVLLYDKETESLWSQLREEPVTGTLTGTKLTALPSVTTTWGRWRKLHPKTLVLSPHTGHSRPYDRNPYDAYERSGEVMFPPSRLDRRLPPKEKVLGIRVGSEEVAFPFSRLARAPQPLEVEIGGTAVTVRYEAPSETAEAFLGTEPLAAFTGYWFAWAAFHPGTEIWGEAGDRPEESPARDSTAGGVTLVEHSGEFADLGGVSPAGEFGESGSFYLVRGTLRNDSGRSIRYVRLVYELVNAAGDVVARETGYNRKAEALRGGEFEGRGRSPGEGDVEPIPPGGTDGFRMFFFRDEVPPFGGYRVRVESVGEGP